MTRAVRAVAFAPALVVAAALFFATCRPASSGSTTATSQPAIDDELAAYIARIRTVDNHTHVGSTAPNDPDTDALPLDGLPPFDLPERVRPDSPVWIDAYKALYGYAYTDLSETHLRELRAARERVVKEQGDRFPEWVLDKAGTDVMFANRIAMGPGLTPPRFRWVPFADALMLPLSTKAEASVNPDRAVLYPLEQKLLARYLADLHVARLPSTLDEYLKAIVTATLEKQRQAGAVAVKFEAAYLRSLAFEDASAEDARRTYARYVNGGEPSHAEYKTLEDFLFRYIAVEAGRLGMAVHIHAFEGAGGFYVAAGSDPLLLEAAFNDPALRKTKFVIIHGGGMYADHTAAMLWKPNVYADISIMVLLYPPAKLAAILRGALLQYPEKVVFGTDASGFGPDVGWDVAAWAGTNAARNALGLALTQMIQAGEVSRRRAEDVATMVLRTNAGKLYNLGLK